MDKFVEDKLWEIVYFNVNILY